MSTTTINGQSYSVMSMPTNPPAPASMEFQHVALVAANSNPFTGQVQSLQWVNSSGQPIGYNITSPFGGMKKVSVSMPAMTSTTAQLWTAFLQSLQGPISVFCFPVSVCNMFLSELTLDGLATSTNPRYFRLQSNSVKWSVAPGGIYNGITFEISEVL